MPIRLDYDVSRKQFQRALELAQSDTALPQGWIERTRKVGQSPSKTFTAMLGTALLAKASDARVDPFALKTRDFPTAYSARSLCKDVLVPCAVEASVSIGSTGREPLNNQPFFRHERVGPDMVVHTGARAHLDYLCQCLSALEPLDSQDALHALAAFLRVRLQEAPAAASPFALEHALGVPELLDATESFISADPEDGKRGQALVAAALDLVFEGVRTTRVYDPSRHWPGDVVVFKDDAVVLAAEVKQRPASETEIIQLTERCQAMGVHRAMAALLAPETPFHDDEVRQEAWRRHNVHLSLLEGSGAVLCSALTWTHRPLAEALTVFPQLMAARLQELEVRPESLEAWAALFKAND
jgi:hypothetical protein